MRSARWLRIATLCFLGLTAVPALGCAHAAGGRAAAGAMQELESQRQQRQESGQAPLVEEAAGHVTRGALGELDTPERQEELSRIVAVATESALATVLGAQAGAAHGVGGGPPPSPEVPTVPMSVLGQQFSTGFAMGLSRQLQLELGPVGEGPLGQSLATLTHEVSAAAVNGATSELAPSDPNCAGPNRQQCTDRRVYEMSKVAGGGFAEGLGRSLRVPEFVITFTAGFIAALLLALLVSTLLSVMGRRRRVPAA